MKSKKKRLTKDNPKRISETKEESLENFVEDLSKLRKEEIDYLWKNVLFSEGFLSATKDIMGSMGEEVKARIKEILNGNFEDVKEQINFQDDFLYGTYVYTFSFSKVKLLFVIYFREIDSIDEIYMEEVLEFLQLSPSMEEINSSINSFFEMAHKKNSGLVFDKLGLVKNSGIFFDRIEEKGSKRIVYPILNKISKKSKLAVEVQVMGERRVQYFDKNKWKPGRMEEAVNLSMLRKNDLDYDKVFNKETLFDGFIPSDREKLLINSKENLIISGRPGTGKTFMLVAQTSLVYLNYLIEYSKVNEKKIDWDYILSFTKRSREESIPGNYYKIVMTSLSQTLCFKSEEIVKKILRNLDHGLDYKVLELATLYKLSSFRNNTHYPLFVNFRKLMFLIDGSIEYPFFERSFGDKLDKSKNDYDCDYDIKFSENTTYQCKFSFPENFDKNSFFFRSESIKTRNFKEINHTHFLKEFGKEISRNPTLNNGVKVGPEEVYSQIISIIKGSLVSYLGKGNGITRRQYLNIGEKLTMLNKEQKNEIYDFFVKYEKWKEKNNYFDFQDVVNHLIRQVIIELVPFNIKLIDVLFIDEVQDFSINQIYLMQLVSRNIKILAGDTCQTISKVNCFRFCDLTSIYYFLNESGFYVEKPKHIQISLNYRCNSKILKFAHLFFQIIFYFFQNTLDKVRLDFSLQTRGQKPFIIDDFSRFYKFFFLTEQDNMFVSNFWLLSKHCFICKNEEKKRELEGVLKKMKLGDKKDAPSKEEQENKKYYALSIEESKGLEFEVVVLYNLFSDMDEESLKKLISIFGNSKITRNRNPYENDFLKELEKENISQGKRDEVIEEFQDYFEFKYDKFIQKSDLHYFFSLCSELKQLYVAITRPKSILVIYEGGKGKAILNCIAKKTDLLDSNDDRDAEGSFRRFLSEQRISPDIIKAEADEAYRNEKYRRALYLYEIIGFRESAEKARILDLYSRMELSNNFDRDQCDRLYQMCRFYNFDEKNIVGRLLIILENYEEALEYFENKGNLKECGHVLLKMNRFLEAFAKYKEANEYSLAIEALSMGRRYEEIFKFLEENKSTTNIEHYVNYYKKYANFYLSTLKDKFDIKIQFTNKEKKNPSSSEQLTKYFTLKFKEIALFKWKDFSTMISSSLEKENDQSIVGVNSFPYLSYKNDKNEKNKIYLFCSDENSYFVVKDEYNFKKTKQIRESNITKCNLLFRFAFDFINECQRKSQKNYEENNEKRDPVKVFLNKYKEKVNEDFSLSDQLSPQSVPLFNIVLSDWEVDSSIFELYQVKIYKQKILTYIINKISPVNDFSPFDIKEIPSEMDNVVRSVVAIARTLPLPEDSVKKNVLAILIPLGYTENALPLLSEDKQILFLALLRKKKLFFEALNRNKISFKFKKITFAENYFFLFHAFLSICICSCLELAKKGESDKRKEADNKKIEYFLELLKPYPRISSVMSEILCKNNNKGENLGSLQKYIIKFKELLAKINQEDQLSFQEMMEAIEIGNTISLIVVTYGMKSSSVVIDNDKVTERDHERFEFIIQLASDLGEGLMLTNTKEFNSLIIVFSAFGAIGVLPFPNTGLSTYFSMFSLCLLNKKSVLLWKGEKEIYMNGDRLNSVGKFDVQGNNLLITKAEAFKRFYIYLTSFISKIRLKFKSKEQNYYSLPFFRNNSSIQKSVQVFFNRQIEKRLSSLLYEQVMLKLFQRTLIKEVTLAKKKREFEEGNEEKDAFDPSYKNKEEYRRYTEPFCDDGLLNFAPFAIFLGSLPSKIETSKITLEKPETDKIFNFFIFLYSELYRANLKETFKPKQFNKIFANYLLFVNLINKFGRLKVKSERNLIEFIPMFKDIKDEYLTEDQIYYLEREECYKECLKDFSLLHALRLLLPMFKPSKILTIIWLKKIYFLIYYILKIKFDDKGFKLFDYNRTCLNTTQTEEELENWKNLGEEWKDEFLKYFEILENFIDYTMNKISKEDGWLYTYFELEIFVILSSISTFNPNNYEKMEKEFGTKVFDRICKKYKSDRNPLQKGKNKVFHFEYYVHDPDNNNYYIKTREKVILLKEVRAKEESEISPEDYTVDYKIYNSSCFHKEEKGTCKVLEEAEKTDLWALLFGIYNFSEKNKKKERFASILEKIFPVVNA